MSEWIAMLAEKIEPHSGRTFRPESQKKVAALERELGWKLPRELATVLETFGPCGFVGSACIYAPDGKEYGVFTLFEAQKIRKDIGFHSDYVGRGWIPFADDEFNNRHVIEAASGRVMFVDYSHSSGDATQVADSIREWFERIVTVEE